MKLKIALLVLLSCIVVTAVALVIIVNPFDSNDIYLTIANPNISFHVGDTINLIDVCNIEYNSNISNQKPVFVSSNVNVVEVNALTGTATCATIGSTTVKVSLKLKDDTTINKLIYITVCEELILPIQVSFESETVTISKNQNTLTNKIVLVGETNIVPTVTFKNNLVNYNYQTGLITTSGITGTDIITVTYKKSNTEYIAKSFTVNIIDSSLYQITANLEKGESKRITYDVNTFGPNVVLSAPVVEDENIATILDSSYGYVYVKALALGTTKIVLASEVAILTIIVNVQ